MADWKTALKEHMNIVPATKPFTVTGRLSGKSNMPARQNIPSPKTVAGQEAARAFNAPRSTSMRNFLIQMKGAAAMERMVWDRYIAEGYIEVAPGVLRHPNGTVVEHG